MPSCLGSLPACLPGQVWNGLLYPKPGVRLSATAVWAYLPARPPACPPAHMPATQYLLRLPLQVYGGLVSMDFNVPHMQRYGHGRYEPLDPSLLPPQPLLQLIYSSSGPSGKDSGRVHSDVKQRWLAGDETVR